MSLGQRPRSCRGKLMRSIIGGLLLFGLASVTACGGDSGVGDSSNDATVSSNTKGLYIIQVVSQFDDFGNAVDVDAAGNIYIGGYVGDVLPGHVNVGRTDGFIRKYDSALNEMWTSILLSSRIYTTFRSCEFSKLC